MSIKGWLLVLLVLAAFLTTAGAVAATVGDGAISCVKVAP